MQTSRKRRTRPELHSLPTSTIARREYDHTRYGFRSRARLPEMRPQHAQAALEGTDGATSQAAWVEARNVVSMSSVLCQLYRSSMKLSEEAVMLLCRCAVCSSWQVQSAFGELDEAS